MQALTQLCFASGVAAGYHNDALMDSFAEEGRSRIQEFSQQNLANMAYAYGKAKHDAPVLMDSIGRRAIAIARVGTAKPDLGFSCIMHNVLIVYCAASLIDMCLAGPVKQTGLL